MRGIVEVTSFNRESFRSRAYVGAKLLTINQTTSWDNQPRSPLLTSSERIPGIGLIMVRMEKWLQRLLEISWNHRAQSCWGKAGLVARVAGPSTNKLVKAGIPGMSRVSIRTSPAETVKRAGISPVVCSATVRHSSRKEDGLKVANFEVRRFHGGNPLASRYLLAVIGRRRWQPAAAPRKKGICSFARFVASRLTSRESSYSTTLRVNS